MNRTLLRSFLIMFGLTVVSLLSLGVSFSFVATADRAVEAATDARYRSYLLADELRQSSDDLTRLARTYVVTGDPKYEDQYWEVLDIRNGKKPRPLSYHRIYWDFVAASGIPPRAADTTVSLQALMKHAGFTDEEFAKLRQAQENSDDLVRTETIAMNAMKGRFDDGKGGYTRVGAPDPDLARQLMHDEKYHAFKAKIMRPVDEFYELMEARTTAAVASARDRAWLFKVVFSSMLALTAILLPVTAWLLYRRLVREIGAEPAEAMRIVDRMSANLGIDLRGEPETLSLMARTIRMHDGLLALIRNVNAHTATVSELAGRLKTTAEAAHRTAGEQSFMLQGLAQDAEELSASIAQVSDSGNGAQEISAQSGALAREGATVIQQAVEEIVTIETTVAQGTTSVEALGEQAEQISSIIKVIKDVADQTNLLALNAAIEAARAGEQGRGFAVVADEVRKLAERTTQSAGQITEMIAAIQSSAAASVTSIRQILVQVRSGVELARKGGASIDQIQTSADRVLSVIEDLSETLRSQRVATSEVSRKTETLAAGLDSNVSAVATVNTVAGELQDVASELKHAIARFDQALATRAA